MKIGQANDPVQPTGTGASGLQKIAKTPSSNGDPVQGVDTIALSATAMQMRPELTHDGAFDQQKVDSLRLSLATGTYQIDAEKIADLLLSDQKELMRASTKS
jgi:flagellar biosynthesis anti-sigma factor FlgM